MSSKSILLSAATLCLLPVGPAAAQTLAISEVMINPSGAPDSDYVEILNHGSSSLDISGFHFADNNLAGGDPSQVVTFPSGTVIGAGERILITQNLIQFRRNYPGVFERAQVFAGGPSLNDDNDELLILDPTFDPNNPADDPLDNIVWNLGYDLDDTTPEVPQGTAFHLAGSNNFAVTDYGRDPDTITSAGQPGPFVVFPGNDLTTPAVIGYEASDDVTNGDSAAGPQGFYGNIGSPGNVGVFSAPTRIAETFSGFDLGIGPDTPPAPWNNSSGLGTTIESDAGTNIFGDDSNRYFRLVDDNTGGGIEEIKAEGLDFGNLTTLQFDLYEPSTNPNPGATNRGRLVTRLFSPEAGQQGTDNRLIDLRWEDGTVEAGGSGVPGDTTSASYALDTALSVVVIVNNTGSTTSYDDGQGGMETVGQDQYDLWVGPQGGTLSLLMDDNFVRGGQILDPDWEITQVSFRTFTGDDNVEAWLDNIFVFNGASLENPVFGDYDGDGDVDGDDLAVWEGEFGNLGGPSLDADGDTNLQVDLSDVLLWQRNYTGSLPVSGVASVPEPASGLFGLLAIGFGVGTRRSAV